jgi:hypothetical protein
MRHVARRLERMERQVAAVAHANDAAWHEIPKHLTFAEICAGQHAIEPFGGDPAAALAAADPTMLALVSAANARTQGWAVASLFHDNANACFCTRSRRPSGRECL